MGKQIIIIILTCFVGFGAMAQNTVTFGYDNNGNRTSVTRSITLKSANGEDADKYYKDSIAGHNITIYPNPVKENLTVDIEHFKIKDKADLHLYDMEGKLIKETKLTKKGSDIYMGDFPNGVYVLIINVNDKQEKWRIIKQ